MKFSKQTNDNAHVIAISKAGAIVEVTVPKYVSEGDTCNMRFSDIGKEGFYWLGSKGFNNTDLKKSIQASRVFKAESEGFNLDFFTDGHADEWCPHCGEESEIPTSKRTVCTGTYEDGAKCGEQILPCAACWNHNTCDWHTDDGISCCTPFPKSTIPINSNL